MGSGTEARYYVYIHVHPITEAVVYVGHGSGARAWACTHFSKGAATGIYGARSREHHGWITKLLDSGFIPSDWVKILKRGLDRQSASNLERQSIEFYNQKFKLFNQPYGVKSAVLTTKQLKTAKQLRKGGKYYRVIAEKIGTSPMTVWRALTGKTRCYVEVNHAA